MDRFTVAQFRPAAGLVLLFAPLIHCAGHERVAVGFASLGQAVAARRDNRQGFLVSRIFAVGEPREAGAERRTIEAQLRPAITGVAGAVGQRHAGQLFQAAQLGRVERAPPGQAVRIGAGIGRIVRRVQVDPGYDSVKFLRGELRPEGGRTNITCGIITGGRSPALCGLIAQAAIDPIYTAVGAAAGFFLSDFHDRRVCDPSLRRHDRRYLPGRRFWPPPASSPAGHCRKCGWVLTGRSRGIGPGPECGDEVARRSNRRRQNK